MKIPKEQQEQVLAKLMALCAKREYASGELLAKMERMGLEPTEAETVLARLQRDHFQDDYRYAVAFSRDKSRLAGWGERKVAYALRLKGVEQEVIRQAWQEVDTQQAWKKFVTLLALKQASLERRGMDEEMVFQRLWAYAQQKGYAWEQVNAYWKMTKNK